MPDANEQMSLPISLPSCATAMDGVSLKAACSAASPRKYRRSCQPAHIQMHLSLEFPPHTLESPRTSRGFDADTEKLLGIAVQNGRLAAEALQHGDLLSGEQRRRFEIVVAHGERAATMLTLGNMGLAYNWGGKWAAANMREDLIQAAMIGLIEASKRYDPKRGRFSTYAFYAIQQAIRRGRRSEYAIIPPCYLAEISRDKIDAMLEGKQGEDHADSPAPFLFLREFLNAVQTPLSLNAPVADGSRDLGEMVSGPDHSVESRVMLQAERAALRAALNALPEPHRSIIVMRFYNDMTFKEISERLSLKYARVLAIAKDAVRMMRNCRELRETFELDVA